MFRSCLTSILLVLVCAAVVHATADLACAERGMIRGILRNGSEIEYYPGEIVVIMDNSWKNKEAIGSAIAWIEKEFELRWVYQYAGVSYLLLIFRTEKEYEVIDIVYRITDALEGKQSQGDGLAFQDPIKGVFPNYLRLDEKSRRWNGGASGFLRKGLSVRLDPSGQEQLSFDDILSTAYQNDCYLYLTEDVKTSKTYFFAGCSSDEVRAHLSSIMPDCAGAFALPEKVIYLWRMGRVDFQLKDASDDREISLSSFRGKRVVLDVFLDLSDETARLEIPVLSSLYRKYHDDGLDIHLIPKESNPQDLRNLKKELSVPFPVLVDPHELVRSRFNIDVPLFNMVVSKDGVIEYTHGGGYPPGADERPFVLEDLLKR